jgi:peptide chain release factor subunit 1
MFSNEDLRTLSAFKSQHDVVSLYLNLDPKDGNIDLHKLRLRKLIEKIDSKPDNQVISDFIESKREWGGRGLVLFSCAADHFFETYTLQIPVLDLVWTDKSPYIKPLIDLMDSFGNYGVLLLNKQSVRIQVFHLGELLAGTDVAGEQIKHVKHGGASSMPGRRSEGAGRTHYEDELEERNMRIFVESAIQFFEKMDIKRILVGGTDENVSKFQSLLPKQWRNMIYQTFSFTKTDREIDILQKALEIGGQVEREREDELVERLVTAAKGKDGVVSLNETLGAIHAGQVQTLLVDRDFHAPAYQCDNCGFLTARKNHDQCPYCGHAVTQIPDAIDMAVQQVIQEGGGVEIVADNPSMHEIGIGALLRYQI